MNDQQQITLEALETQLRNQKKPPVQSWHPQKSGTIDITIMRDGRWLHEGSEIKRSELVRLFAGILRLDDDGYYLVTPVEKLSIEVQDAPFIAVSARYLKDEDQRRLIVLETNVGDEVLLDAAHPMWVEEDPVTAEPSPYMHVRHGLNALISRNVYYELVDAGEIRGNELILMSAGELFSLGLIGAQ